MSGRRTTSRPSLGVQLLAAFLFVSQGKWQFKECLGKRLEVPDVLLPDIRGLLIQIPTKRRHFQGITREIRNFSENNYFRIIFRK